MAIYVDHTPVHSRQDVYPPTEARICIAEPYGEPYWHLVEHEQGDDVLAVGNWPGNMATDAAGEREHLILLDRYFRSAIRELLQYIDSAELRRIRDRSRSLSINADAALQAAKRLHSGKKSR